MSWILYILFMFKPFYGNQMYLMNIEQEYIKKIEYIFLNIEYTYLNKYVNIP